LFITLSFLLERVFTGLERRMSFSKTKQQTAKVPLISWSKKQHKVKTT